MAPLGAPLLSKAAWDQDRAAVLVPALLGAALQSQVQLATFDATSSLPPNWQQEVSQVAEDADFRLFPPTPILSREAADVLHIHRGRVHAYELRKRLPWLYRAYRSDFLEYAKLVRDEPVFPASDDRYGVVLNVQQGTDMRFECHVDSNPLSGVLFCTDHSQGGELVFAHDTDAAGIDAVEESCLIVQPRAGQLIFFDAREHPHYARSLGHEADTRIVAVMNFYTESCPETTRPEALNRHLYGGGS